MIAQLDVENARRWVSAHCNNARIRATIKKALAYVDAVEQAGLDVEAIDRDELHAFLADAAGTPEFNRHFVRPTL